MSKSKRLARLLKASFFEAINGLFQTTKRKAQGYEKFTTIRAVIFLLAYKLNFAKVNPFAS